MKHCKSALVLAGALSTMLLNGCKSDDLDLGDIDTTMKIEVNDLVLPVNLAPIVFDDMVDLSDTEGIEIINGEYVLLKEGSFESEVIEINPISTTATPHYDSPADIPVAIITQGVTIPLEPLNFPFSYSSKDVDTYIKQIVSGVLNLDIVFKIRALDNNRKKINCEYNNMTFELPKGFYGNLNGEPVTKETNIITLTKPGYPNEEGDYIVTFHVDSFEFSEIPDAYFEAPNFNITTEFALKSGSATILSGNGTSGHISFYFDMSTLELKEFTGIIKYELENMNPEEVSLNDLPDVLTDPKTSLGLKNPQLYVNLTNPLGHIGLTASTGLTIEQVRPDAKPEEKWGNASLANPLQIAAVEGVQEFCLSPQKPQKNYEEYPDAKWDEMKNLGEIVKGNGLPQGLSILFENPEVNESMVYGFQLGKELGQVMGNYTFFAPLDLSEGSHIFYEEESTGWDLGGEDNQLDIRSIKLTAYCISDLPVKVTISAHPLDSKGNLIPNIEVKPVEVEAYGKQDIEILITGNIKDLDGMKYNISINAGQKTDVLKPTMTLKLDNLKLKVSGSYLIDEND